MAVNPFEQYGNMGGYGFGGGGGMTTPNLGGQQGSLMPQRGGRGTSDMPSPGFSPGTSPSPIQNTAPFIPPQNRGGQRSPMDVGQAGPPSLNSIGGFGGWRNQMSGFGGSPFTYTQPQNPWMQQGGPWGMANRGANPYFGQNTADPRFQQGGMWGGQGGPWGQQGINPMWQALMQQRFMPQQQPQPQQRDLWIMGQNPYAQQQPTTGQGISGPVQGPSQWQGLQQRYASDNRRKPDFI